MEPKDFITAIVGIILGVILQDPLTKLRDGVIHRYKRLFYKKHIDTTEEFVFGNIKTSWRIVDGNGEEEYNPDTITTHFESKKLTPHEEIKKAKEQVTKAQEALHKDGKPFAWNGDMLTMQKFLISRYGNEEKQSLEMWFHETDYYTFMATDQVLEDEETREKILQEVDWQRPIPSVCNSLGVDLLVVTQDEYLILTKRSEHVGTYKDLYHISMNEGLSRALDRNVHSQAPDVYRCAIRGLAEELGVVDVTAEDISLLSFGVDTQHAQWGILGLAKINKKADEVLEWRNKGAKDKWEANEIYFLKFHIDEVVKFVAEHPHWTPAGLACLYHCLVHEFKRHRVEAAIKKYIH